MYTAGYGDPMPADKLMRLFIIQSISSFVAGDHESGLHYINEIKQTYAQYMMNLNPTLKSLAKEIIASLDLLDPGATTADLKMTNVPHETSQEQPTQPTDESSGQSEKPSSVASELQNLLNRRRASRNK